MSVAQHAGDPSAPSRAWLPLTAAGITMVLWASAYVVRRALSDAVAPGPLAFGRLLVGLVAMIVIAAAWPGRGWVSLPRGRALVLVIAYGVLWYGIYTIVVNAAGSYLDAGTTAMIINLAPIIVAILAGIFLRERLSRQLVFGIIIAFAGVVIIASASRSGEIDPRGVTLALISAVLYAVGVLLQKQALATVDPVTVTWLGALAGTVATLPFAGQLVHQLADDPWTATAGVLYLGLFPTAIAYLLWTYALSRTGAGQLAASAYVLPAITLLQSWLFLNEIPGAVALIGGAISVVGVVVTQLPGRPVSTDAGPR
ncbi:MAG: DMT family transporter [Microlunatus sp.]